MRAHRQQHGPQLTARAALVIFFILAAGFRSSGQDVTGPAVMAAGLLSFAKFTEWPAEALGPTDTVSICVLGETPVAQALEKHVRGRLVGDHPISVSQVTADASLTSCHLLWVSGLSAERAGKAIAPLRDLPVLTIGDVDGFTDSGGIARLFFEHGSLRFRVKVEHAKRARLTISSHVLRLAQGP